MWFLFGTTVIASFFDSLNPSAIVQQMLLQAMVKKKQHIWFFICGIGLANLLMGLTIYCGIAAWVSRYLSWMLNAYPVQVYGFSTVGGAALFFLGICLVLKTRRQNRICMAGGGEQVNAARVPAQLSPASLFIMGAAFCLVELTSALPYFGFLALLASYRLMFPLAVLLMLIYDFIYMLPLILLYFGYNKLQGTAAIKTLENVMAKVSSYIVPAAVSLAGGFLTYYGGFPLLQ